MYIFISMIQLCSSFLIVILILSKYNPTDMNLIFGSNSFNLIIGTMSSDKFFSRIISFLVSIFFISTLILTYINASNIEYIRNYIQNHKLRKFY